MTLDVVNLSDVIVDIGTEDERVIRLVHNGDGMYLISIDQLIRATPTRMRVAEATSITSLLAANAAWEEAKESSLSEAHVRKP